MSLSKTLNIFDLLIAAIIEQIATVDESEKDVPAQAECKLAERQEDESAQPTTSNLTDSEQPESTPNVDTEATVPSKEIVTKEIVESSDQPAPDEIATETSEPEKKEKPAKKESATQPSVSSAPIIAPTTERGKSKITGKTITGWL